MPMEGDQPTDRTEREDRDMLSPRPRGYASRRQRGPRTFHFGLGAALSRSLSFFGKHFLPLCGFALLIFAPLGIYTLSAAETAFTKGSYVELVGMRMKLDFWAGVVNESGALGRLMEGGLPFILHAMVTLAVFQYLKGGSVQFGRSFSRGFSRILSVVGVAVLLALILLVVVVVIGLLLGAIFLSGGATEIGVAIVQLAAAITALVVITIFFVAVQATVVEKRVGAARALSRSSWLTRGARWKILGIVLIVGAVAYGAQAILQQIIGDDPETWSRARLGVLLSVGISAVFAVFQAVCAAVVYHDLRQAKEGVGVEELIKVFD